MSLAKIRKKLVVTSFRFSQILLFSLAFCFDTKYSHHFFDFYVFKMPKKFTGENSKAAEARARKNDAKAEVSE
jgi:hypothetical protein